MIQELQTAISDRIRTDNTFFGGIGVSYTITGVANNQSTHIVTLTIGQHIINVSDKILIASVGGMTSLNGIQTIYAITNTTIQISITTAQSYTTGGTIKVSRFYYSIAPINTTGKYAILSDVANPNSIDTGNLFEECYFQIAIYDTATQGVSSSAGVHTLATYCKTLFDNCLGIMTVTNYNLTSFRRMNIIGPRSTQLNDGFVIILNYYATLQKGR